MAIWITSKREGSKMFAKQAAYDAIREQSQTLARRGHRDVGEANKPLMDRGRPSLGK